METFKLPDPYAGMSRDELRIRVRKIGSKLDLVLVAISDLEDEVREQAQGEQDGYLLGIADKLRAIYRGSASQ